MIISELETNRYIQVQKDTWRWIKATGYHQTIICKHLDLSPLTVRTRFLTQTWKARDFKKVIEIINSKKK